MEDAKDGGGDESRVGDWLRLDSASVLFIGVAIFREFPLADKDIDEAVDALAESGADGIPDWGEAGKTNGFTIDLAGLDSDLTGEIESLFEGETELPGGIPEAEVELSEDVLVVEAADTDAARLRLLGLNVGEPGGGICIGIVGEVEIVGEGEYVGVYVNGEFIGEIGEDGKTGVDGLELLNKGDGGVATVVLGAVPGIGGGGIGGGEELKCEL